MASRATAATPTNYTRVSLFRFSLTANQIIVSFVSLKTSFSSNFSPSCSPPSLCVCARVCVCVRVCMSTCISTLTCPVLSEPNKPVSVIAVAQTTSSIKITWSAPEGGVARYKTILNRNNPRDNGLVTEKTFNGLTAGTLYTMNVYTETDDGTQSDHVTRQYYTGNKLITRSMFVIKLNVRNGKHRRCSS